MRILLTPCGHGTFWVLLILPLLFASICLLNYLIYCFPGASVLDVLVKHPWLLHSLPASLNPEMEEPPTDYRYYYFGLIVNSHSSKKVSVNSDFIHSDQAAGCDISLKKWSYSLSPLWSNLSQPVWPSVCSTCSCHRCTFCFVLPVSMLQLAPLSAEPENSSSHPRRHDMVKHMGFLLRHCSRGQSLALTLFLKWLLLPSGLHRDFSLLPLKSAFLVKLVSQSLLIMF